MTSTWDYDDSKDLRSEMVIEQIQHRGIGRENILQAFGLIPRHLFIPHVSLDEAYSDHPIPIAAGQTISQPYIVALMIEYLELKREHTVLEIGSGSGYSTALLASLCQHIDAIEVFDELIQMSRVALDKLSIRNFQLFHHSAWEQFSEAKVYDRIIMWASPSRIPSHLIDNLTDGGILVAPEGKGDQYVWIYRKEGKRIIRQQKDAVRFVPLVQGSANEINSTMKGYKSE